MAVRASLLKTTVIPLAIIAVLALFGCSNSVAINGVAYPVNSKGQSYGSAARVEIPEGAKPTDHILYYPDLILVENADGIEGYVLKEDFLFPVPRTPEEALEMTAEGVFGEHDVAMYDKEGNSIGDTFTIGSN